MCRLAGSALEYVGAGEAINCYTLVSQEPLEAPQGEVGCLKAKCSMGTQYGRSSMRHAMTNQGSTTASNFHVDSQSLGSCWDIHTLSFRSLAVQLTSCIAQEL